MDEEEEESSGMDDLEIPDEPYSLDELEQMNDSNATIDEDSKNWELSTELGRGF